MKQRSLNSLVSAAVIPSPSRYLSEAIHRLYRSDLEREILKPVVNLFISLFFSLFPSIDRFYIEKRVPALYFFHRQIQGTRIIHAAWIVVALMFH